MDVLQSVAVVAANAAVPGSGVLVNSGFELAKVCFQIAQILAGMGESASSIATQRENIEEDVEEFAYVLGVLKQRVGNQEKLSEGLQSTILRFEGEVKEYNRIVTKFKSRSLLKQLIFRKEMDFASLKTKKTTAAAVVVASRSPSEELLVREKRYMTAVDSPEVTTEMADVETQKELLALLKSVDKRHGDPVVSVIKEKLRSSSSAAVKNEVNSLPSWYLTEDQVEIDETATLGFGGDARIYKGVLSKKTPVAVKVFNLKAGSGNKKLGEKARLRFIETLKLWRKLRHRSICRFHGACYLTKTPFVVMELCDLGPLDKFLRRDEGSRGSVALEMLLQASQAVLKTHCSGIVHGDLKCDNILIQSRTGKSSARLAKVCDFDRSFDWSALKSKKTKAQQRLEDMSAATMGVEITGAIPWLAPECVQGRLPSPASDVYAFGMTLYQALTGKAPFYHANSDEVLRKWKLEHKLPRRESKTIATDVWELIKRTSHADPFKRPSMQEVMKALKGFVNNGKQQQTEKKTSNQQEINEAHEEDGDEDEDSVKATGALANAPSGEVTLPEINHAIAISIEESAPSSASGSLREKPRDDQGTLSAPAQEQQQSLETGSLDPMDDEKREKVRQRRKKCRLLGVTLFLLLLGGLLAIYFST
ncbi:unnamed protein product [Globisporangium polare]